MSPIAVGCDAHCLIIGLQNPRWRRQEHDLALVRDFSGHCPSTDLSLARNAQSDLHDADPNYTLEPSECYAGKSHESHEYAACARQATIE